MKEFTNSNYSKRKCICAKICMVLEDETNTRPTKLFSTNIFKHVLKVLVSVYFFSLFP